MISAQAAVDFTPDSRRLVLSSSLSHSVGEMARGTRVRRDSQCNGLGVDSFNKSRSGVSAALEMKTDRILEFEVETCQIHEASPVTHVDKEINVAVRSGLTARHRPVNPNIRRTVSSHDREPLAIYLPGQR